MRTKLYVANLDGELTSVDTWNGREGRAVSFAAAKREALAHLRDKIRALEYAKRGVLNLLLTDEDPS